MTVQTTKLSVPNSINRLTSYDFKMQHFSKYRYILVLLKDCGCILFMTVIFFIFLCICPSPVYACHCQRRNLTTENTFEDKPNGSHANEIEVIRLNKYGLYLKLLSTSQVCIKGLKIKFLFCFQTKQLSHFHDHST